MQDCDYQYVHFHDLPDGRIESVYYDGPSAKQVIRREILPPVGANGPWQRISNLDGYKCDCCRNWGNGIEKAIEWVKPLG